MKIFYQTGAEIESLVQQFNERVLPAPAWTHEAHLTVGLYFNKKYTPHEAICYLRSGIISYNLAMGGENTPSKGYHETLTLFWAKILEMYVNAYPNKTLLDLCNDFLNSPLASRTLALQYYTPELLYSTQARALWVSPDQSSL